MDCSCPFAWGHGRVRKPPIAVIPPDQSEGPFRVNIAGTAMSALEFALIPLAATWAYVAALRPSRHSRTSALRLGDQGLTVRQICR